MRLEDIADEWTDLAIKTVREQGDNPYNVDMDEVANNYFSKVLSDERIPEKYKIMFKKDNPSKRLIAGFIKLADNYLERKIEAENIKPPEKHIITMLNDRMLFLLMNYCPSIERLGFIEGIFTPSTEENVEWVRSDGVVKNPDSSLKYKD